MFLKVKKFKNQDGSTREYLYVVENRRINGKHKQINIANLGRLDILREKGQIDSLAEKLAKFCERVKLLDITQDLTPDWAKGYGMV